MMKNNYVCDTKYITLYTIISLDPDGWDSPKKRLKVLISIMVPHRAIRKSSREN